MTKHFFLPGVVLFGFMTCAQAGTDNIFLSFMETGPDGDNPVRMLITEQYLRIEDGDGRDGFILFDRKQRRIQSVSHEARSTLVIEARPVKQAAPSVFKHRRESGKDTPPAISGKAVAHYRYFTNDQLCFEVYAAAGLLPVAVRALREYHEALAGEQAAMQAGMPSTLQQACELADQVYLPARYLEQGFPVRWVRAAGVTRQLTGFKSNVPLEPRLFELPKDYKSFSAASQRGGTSP